MEGTKWLSLCYISTYQPGLSRLEGIKNKAPAKYQGEIHLHCAECVLTFRHSLQAYHEFQVTLYFHFPLHLGGITRNLEFKDILNDYKLVRRRNLVDHHGKALTMGTAGEMWAKHVKTTHTWKGSHRQVEDHIKADRWPQKRTFEKPFKYKSKTFLLDTAGKKRI